VGTIWGQIVTIFRTLGRAITTAIACITFSLPATADTANLGAFEGFVANGKYRDANFYLANGFLTASEIDTSQLFYSVLHSRFGDDIRRNARGIDELYNYLTPLGSIDLGCVDKVSDPQPDRRDENEAEEAIGGFVVSRG
jgi:hypothetical protein